MIRITKRHTPSRLHLELKAAFNRDDFTLSYCGDVITVEARNGIKDEDILKIVDAHIPNPPKPPPIPPITREELLWLREQRSKPAPIGVK